VDELGLPLSSPSVKESGHVDPKGKVQDEFTFGEQESRGHFENTDRNLFEGQDLDVPTYLRKGIKLAL
jgi:cell division protein FtsZ